MTAHHGAHAHNHGHTHTHPGTQQPDWDAFAPMLEQGAEVHTPLYDQATAWLRERFTASGGSVRRVLDVGSGPGVLTCLLARAFPEAEVVAVDGTPALLERARERAARLGLDGRVTTVHAELPEGLDPAVIGTADLVWSSKTVHHLGDQPAALRRLAAALRPGGLLALGEGGLPTRFLPRDAGLGRPDLLTRLDAIQGERFAEMRAELPDATETVEDWPGLLTAAGLTGATSRSFLLDLPAPLGAAARDFLRNELVRWREAAADRLDDGDLATLARLLDPDDEAGIMRRPDAFLLTASTFHVAAREK
ncbi:class I SAM-dependent methyltransferase [Streptomyces sp. RTd22]|uniref:class I SAM-dependent methyltransferase n=1 Tax=Streptomyces sp. RTd22 TaxID=1841249 RepID=UPI0007C473E9|nr:class I SAM-dependent methyltransferase [Streptomyces sp. RTd22]